MALEKVRITGKYANTQLTARTMINGNEMVLTEDFFLVSAATFETDPAYKGKHILKYEFSPMNKFVEIVYDHQDRELPDKKEQPRTYSETVEWNELNKRKRLAVTEFWARHNQVQHKTEFKNNFTPNLQPIAEIEIVTQRARNFHLSDRKKVMIFRMVDEMSWQDQYDLALYYNPASFGKRRSEVLNELLGLRGIGTDKASTGGMLWQGNNADDFLANYHNNPTVAMKIYVSKAVALKVLEQGTGGLYMNGGATFVGKDIQDAVIFFSKELQLYTNIVQPEVNKLSALPEDDLGDIIPIQGKPVKQDNEIRNAAKTASYIDNMKMVAKEWTELGGKGSKGYNEMVAELPKLREAAELKRQEQALPTTGLLEAIDPLATDRIDLLKEIAEEEGVPSWQLYKKPEVLREKIKEHRDKKIKENV